MSHNIHIDLPGYDPQQLLVDGCAECEQRAADPALAIAHMDTQRFEQAWLRAVDWMAHGRAKALSSTEQKVLAPIWAIIVQLERRGVPIGPPPKGHAEQVRDALDEVFPGLSRDAEAHREREREINRQEAEVDAAFKRGAGS